MSQYISNGLHSLKYCQNAFGKILFEQHFFLFLAGASLRGHFKKIEGLFGTFLVVKEVISCDVSPTKYIKTSFFQGGKSHLSWLSLSFAAAGLLAAIALSR